VIVQKCTSSIVAMASRILRPAALNFSATNQIGL